MKCRISTKNKLASLLQALVSYLDVDVIHMSTCFSLFQGLRNVLRKSRTHRRSDDESLELQPLHLSPCGEGATPKGPLKRMQRVKSHDLSQDEAVSNVAHEQPQQQHQGGGESITSPLGAGLPLLSRLR